MWGPSVQYLMCVYGQTTWIYSLTADARYFCSCFFGRLLGGRVPHACSRRASAVNSFIDCCFSETQYLQHPSRWKRQEVTWFRAWCSTVVDVSEQKLKSSERWSADWHGCGIGWHPVTLRMDSPCTADDLVHRPAGSHRKSLLKIQTNRFPPPL